MDKKTVHYERVSINKARKLWLKGESIYCLPIYSKDDGDVEGFHLSVYTNKEKDESFEEFVKMYKSLSRYNMRYYIEH